MKPWLFNRDLYSRVWNNPYINGYDFIPFTTNPTRFLIPAQWPPSNQNHQHIFHRFETCTCSWTKSSQQQWHPPRRPYWVINYHDPLGRPYFLQRWHWAGGLLKFPMTHSHGKPQLGRRSAFCPKPAAMLTSQAYPTQLPLSCTDTLVQSQGMHYETKHVSG